MWKHCTYSTTSTPGSCIAVSCRKVWRAEHKSIKDPNSEKLKLWTTSGQEISGMSSDTDAKIHHFVSKGKWRQFHQCKEHFTAQLGSQGKSWPRFQTECTNFSQSYIRIWWKSDCHEKKSFYIKITVLWHPAVAMPRSVLISRVSWLTGVYIFLMKFKLRINCIP